MVEVPFIDVEFRAGDLVIGHARLSAADPSMGVGLGEFVPAKAYRALLHANILGGHFIGAFGKTLTMHAPDGSRIEVVDIAIDDFISELGKAQVHVFFENSVQYENLFPGAYEAEKQFWREQKR